MKQTFNELSILLFKPGVMKRAPTQNALCETLVLRTIRRFAKSNRMPLINKNFSIHVGLRDKGFGDLQRVVPGRAKH